MPYGAVGAAYGAAMVFAFFYVVIAAVIVSTVVGLWSRRALAWTPLVLVAILTASLFTVAGLVSHVPYAQMVAWVVVLAVACVLWFWWAWPKANRDVKPDHKPQWRPGSALGVSFGAFGLSCLPLVMLLIDFNNRWTTNSSPGTSARPAVAKKTVPKRPAPTRPAPTRPKPPVVSPPSPTGAELDALYGTEATHDGLTWTVQSATEQNGVRYVLVGADERSNAYAGDTSPKASLPILAIRPTEAAAPAGVDPDRWSHGEVMLTEPIKGSHLPSLAFANFLIEEKHGPGWRMASFHEAAGWRFWATGDLEVGTGQRFWVTIRDQPANPWD